MGNIVMRIRMFFLRSKRSVKQLALLLWDRIKLPESLKRLAIVLYSKSAFFLVGTSAVVVDEEGGVLLFNHRYNNPHSWYLPGGVAKHGYLRRSLQREIKRESGFLIEVREPLGIIRSGEMRLIVVFDASIVGGEFSPTDEVKEIGFFALDKLPSGVGSDTAKILKLFSQSEKDGFRIDHGFHGYKDLLDAPWENKHPENGKQTSIEDVDLFGVKIPPIEKEPLDKSVSIQIEDIPQHGHPEKRAIPCNCGGTLVYGPKPLHTSWTGPRMELQHLKVKSVWGFRCSNPECSVTILLREDSEELRRRINNAVFSIPQR